jgi:deoxyribonuclease V
MRRRAPGPGLQERSLRRAELVPKQAVALQRELALLVERAWRPRSSSAREPRTVAGSDVSLRAGRARAAVVVLSFPELALLESVVIEREVRFPYVPGLLSFREIPALLEAFDRLAREPDVVIVDGHGLAHPRRVGIASHLGLELDLPTIGCAKSLLVGEHRAPGPRRGARTRLVHQGERVGTCLRTRARVQPVYVSIGHRMDLALAERLVLACATRYRLPWPTHLADRLAGDWDAPGASGPARGGSAGAIPPSKGKRERRPGRMGGHPRANRGFRP